MANDERLQPGEVDLRFLTLVMSLATAAWSQLGKIPHPSTQKIEKDLEQAKMSIDFLSMLLEKTKGNLKPKEDELLSNTVSDLQLNFADEAKKAGEMPEKKGPDIIIPSGAGKGPEIIKP
jgi:hypothetical protein